MDDDRFLKEKIEALLSIIKDLEEKYPNRKFTLDGHLLGSIGEIVAAQYYGIELGSQSQKCHDGITKDGRNVQIKITQIQSVDIQEIPEWLIVLFMEKTEVKFYEVYNGPGEKVLKGVKKTKSGYYNRSLNRLSEIDKGLSVLERLPFVSDSLAKCHMGIKNE